MFLALCAAFSSVLGNVIRQRSVQRDYRRRGRSSGALLCVGARSLVVVGRGGTIGAPDKGAPRGSLVVAKPLVGSLLGMIVLGETLEFAGLAVFVVVAGAALVIVSTVALAHGEAEKVNDEAIESGRIPRVADPRAAAVAVSTRR